MIKRVVCVFMLILASFSCRSGEEKDRLTISMPQNIYLGKIVVGTPVQFFVKCVNNGEEEVRLKEIDTPCSCLRIVGRYTNLMSAHDTLLLEFTYVPEGGGYTEKNIKFYFNKFKDPLALKLSAHIKDSITGEIDRKL